jgi:hypothetical protein
MELINTITGIVSAVFAAAVFFGGLKYGKKYFGHKRYVGEEAQKIYDEQKDKVPQEQKFGPYQRGGRIAVPQLVISPIIFGSGAEKGYKREVRFFYEEEDTKKRMTRGWWE